MNYQYRLGYMRPFGYTLIELLLVMTIISLLAGVGGLIFTSAQRSGRDSARQADLKKIQDALETYYSDHHAYPNTGGLDHWSAVTVFSPELEGYIKELPSDPGSGSYVYSSDGTCYCLSAKLEKQDLDGDGQPGAASAEGACSHYDPDGTPDTDDEYNYTITCP